MIESIGKLVNEFSKLPGVGKKTAQRYAYKVIDMTESEAREFADAIIGVKRSTLAMWESGANMPPTKYLLAIAEVLGCTVDELLKPSA